MKFFIDTADVSEIKDLSSSGFLDGVTTNPSLIKKSGRNINEVIAEICDIVPGPVSAEVAAINYEDMIAEAQAEWLIQSWEGDVDGSKVSLSFKWVIEDHVIASHFKGNNSESYSLIAVNPESGEVEQTGYNKDGKKNTGSWGPKDEMPFLKLTSKDGEGNSQTMGVGFRLIDKNNIELQIFNVDASGSVADFSEYSLEMKRVKSKRKI